MGNVLEGFFHNSEKLTGEIHKDLILDPRISDGAVRFYAYLHYIFRNQSPYDPPEKGRKAFAGDLNRSERTISNYVNELTTHDWMVVVERISPDMDSNLVPFYHVFALQGDAIRFRQEYVCKADERIRSKSDKPVTRTGRKKGKAEISPRTPLQPVSRGVEQPDSPLLFEVDGNRIQGEGVKPSSHLNTSVVSGDSKSLKDSQAKNTPVQDASHDGQEQEQPHGVTARDYIPVVCFAFNQVETRKAKSKKTGEIEDVFNTYISKITKWCRAAYKPTDRDDEWRQTAPCDEPVEPLELVAFALWYQQNPRYLDAWKKDKSLPQTPATLRDRLDEFRGAIGYPQAMRNAERKLAELASGAPAPKQQPTFQSSSAADLAWRRENNAIFRGEV